MQCNVVNSHEKFPFHTSPFVEPIIVFAENKNSEHVLFSTLQEIIAGAGHTSAVDWWALGKS